MRGHVFADEKNETVVIAIKGTSALLVGGGGRTGRNDKINVSLNTMPDYADLGLGIDATLALGRTTSSSPAAALAWTGPGGQSVGATTGHGNVGKPAWRKP